MDWDQLQELIILSENIIKEIVRKCYLKYLNREPDYAGLEHFVNLMKAKQIDEEELINKLKNSTEYKLSHPVEIEPDTSVDAKMKKEWDKCIVLCANCHRTEEKRIRDARS